MKWFIMLLLIEAVVLVFKFWFDALFGADVDGENKREIKTCPPPPGFFG